MFGESLLDFSKLSSMYQLMFSSNTANIKGHSLSGPTWNKETVTLMRVIDDEERIFSSDSFSCQ